MPQHPTVRTRTLAATLALSAALAVAGCSDGHGGQSASAAISTPTTAAAGTSAAVGVDDHKLCGSANRYAPAIVSASSAVPQSDSLKALLQGVVGEMNTNGLRVSAPLGGAATAAGNAAASGLIDMARGTPVGQDAGAALQRMTALCSSEGLANVIE